MFYARFELSNKDPPMQAPEALRDSSFTISKADVRKTFNNRKAAGPDGISELVAVIADIFNTSLKSSTVPTCFESTTIIPIPKKTKESCLNDYCPVSLTSIVMKCFERLVL